MRDLAVDRKRKRMMADNADGTGLMVIEEVEDDTRWGAVDVN